MLLRRLALPLTVLAATAIVFVCYVEATIGQLPEHVATHFENGGMPNGWMTRATHEKFMLGFGLGVPLFLTLVFIGVRALGGVGLNIPHRAYWLAPVRRTATLDFVLVHGLWFASLMLAFMAGVHRVILSANASAPIALQARDFALLLVGFLTGVGIWIYGLTRHFTRPADAKKS